MEELMGLTEFHLLRRNTRMSLCGVKVDLREGHTVATNSRELTCPQCMRLVFLEYSRLPLLAGPQLISVQV